MTSTRPMIERLRLREVMSVGFRAGLAWRQHQQQATVVVIRGKDVGHGGLRSVSLRIDHDWLAENPNAPLERCGDVVASVFELESENVARRAADHVEVAEPGQLASAAPGADQAALLVAEEEGRVGRRVVVVEQLEEKAEAALLAAASAALEAGGAIRRDAAVATVRADEVRHGRRRLATPQKRRAPSAGGSRPRWE